jgi:hypothetical protein
MSNGIAHVATAALRLRSESVTFFVRLIVAQSYKEA